MEAPFVVVVSFKKFQKLLIDRGIRKKDLAHRAGVCFATISKLRQQQSATLQLDVLLKICGALDCRLDDIMEYRFVPMEKAEEDPAVLLPYWEPD